MKRPRKRPQDLSSVFVFQVGDRRIWREIPITRRRQKAPRVTEITACEVALTGSGEAGDLKA